MTPSMRNLKNIWLDINPSK